METFDEQRARLIYKLRETTEPREQDKIKQQIDDLEEGVSWCVNGEIYDSKS